MLDMLHIILTILKVAGILLAVLLLLLLLLLLTVLFLPIRYRADMKKDTSWREAAAYVNVYWLYGLLTVRGTYEKETFHCYLKIFHKKIMLVGEEQEAAKQQNAEEKVPGPGTTEPKQDRKKTEQPKEVRQIQKEDAPAEEKQLPEPKPGSEPKPDHSGHVWGRWQRKIQGALQKIRDRIGNTCRYIRETLRSLRKSKEKMEDYLGFFGSDLSREVYQILKGHLRYLLFHIRPRRIKGRLQYGFSDPAYTGEFTGMLYLFLPAGYSGLQLCPDFENRVCEGELTFSGHIRVFHITKTAVKIFFDKKLKLYWKRLKQLRRA